MQTCSPAANVFGLILRIINDFPEGCLDRALRDALVEPPPFPDVEISPKVLIIATVPVA